MKTFGIALAVALVLMLILTLSVPEWRVAANNWRTSMLKADETSVYENLETVESACRSMIASYEADRQKAETYRESHPDWAEQAKIRANQTAATYNNYVLKNRFLWAGNVPADIRGDLPLID